MDTNAQIPHYPSIDLLCTQMEGRTIASVVPATVAGRAGIRITLAATWVDTRGHTDGGTVLLCLPDTEAK